MAAVFAKVASLCLLRFTCCQSARLGTSGVLAAGYFGVTRRSLNDRALQGRRRSGLVFDGSLDDQVAISYRDGSIAFEEFGQVHRRLWPREVKALGRLAAQPL